MLSDDAQAIVGAIEGLRIAVLSLSIFLVVFLGLLVAAVRNRS